MSSKPISVFTLIAASCLLIPATPSAQSLVARWTFDSISTDGSTFNDASGNGHYAVGTNLVTTVQGIRGSALDGSGNNFELSVTNTMGGDVSPARYTIEAWVYSNVAWTHDNVTANDIYSNGYSVSGVALGFSLYVQPDGHASVCMATPSGSSWSTATSPGALSIRTWYYLAGVYNGTSLSLYVNGVLSSTTTASSSYPKGTQYSAHIGCTSTPAYYASNSGNRLNGMVDEVALYDYALSAATLAAHYYSTAPDTGAVAHWTFDSVSTDTGVIYDRVGPNAHPLVNIWGKVRLTDGISGTALDMADMNHRLMGPGAASAFAVQQFSFTGWVYSYIDLTNPGSFSAYRPIFSYGRGLPGISEGYGIEISDFGKAYFTMARADGVAHWVEVESDSSITPNCWYHVAASYDGSAMRVYLNGRLAGTTVYSGGIEMPPPDSVRVGCPSPNPGYDYFVGRFDEFSFYNRALSATEIQSSYAALKPADKAPFEINLGMRTVHAQPGDQVWVPVFLANYEDYSISACQFTVNFDTTIATLIDVKADSGIAREWMLSYNLNQQGTVSCAMGGASKPLNYGEGELVRCLFKVKSPLSNGAHTDLVLSKIVVDESYGLVTATSTPGKIIIDRVTTVYGDVTGNNVANVFDAQKVLEYVVGRLKLPDASVPNFTTAVADVSGNGSVTSYDAALIFQYSVGLISCFPVETALGLTKRAETQVPTATLSLVSQTSAQEVTFNMVGTGMMGFVAGEFTISYDPAKIDLSMGDIVSPIRGTTLRSMTDLTARTLKIAVTVTDNIDENTPVSLLTIKLPAQAVQDVQKSLSLSAALINEGRIRTNLLNQGLVPASSPLSGIVIAGPSLRAFVRDRSVSVLNPGGQPASIRLLDLQGKVIARESIQAGTTQATVGLRTLPIGLYYCTILQSSKTVIVPIVIRGRF